MTENHNERNSEAWLWEKYRGVPERAGALACPAAKLLGAYLDGLASGREARAVEEHLSSCPSCLAAFRELRSRRLEMIPAVPPRVLERAKSLVAAPPPAIREFLGIPDTISAYLRRTAGWAAAAACIAAAAFTGFSLGRSAVLDQKQLAEEGTSFLAGRAYGELSHKEGVIS